MANDYEGVLFWDLPEDERNKRLALFYRRIREAPAWWDYMPSTVERPDPEGVAAPPIDNIFVN
jgi:hypothetical protein